VLAAAALSASLLSGPIVGGSRPTSAGGTLAVLFAAGGLLVSVAAAFRLLASRRRISNEFNAGTLMTTLKQADALDDSARFYTTMIARLSHRGIRNAAFIEQLAADFTAMLCGILVMLCGLAVSAIVG
jgi:hypothetical protein